MEKEKIELATCYLRDNNISISVMESCTGGLLASSFTDVEGCSSVFKLGLVTYTNEAKMANGISKDSIEKYGVYSPQISYMMAYVSSKLGDSDIGIGVTGTLANKDPNNKDSEIGVIYYTIYNKTNNSSVTMNLRLSDYIVVNCTRKTQKEFVVLEIMESLLSMLNK